MFCIGISKRGGDGFLEAGYINPGSRVHRAIALVTRARSTLVQSCLDHALGRIKRVGAVMPLSDG